MSNFKVLFLGELQRMKKYNVFTGSIIISLLWVAMLHFTEVQDVGFIFPLLLFIDATSMAILLIGVTIFYEKQENTLKTLMVSPINKSEYILAKTCANIITNLEALVILNIYARIFKEINLNILGFVIAVIFVSFLHSLIGFLLTYAARDFTELLMGVMKYTFLLMIPPLLEQVGLIRNQLFSRLLYILPTKASLLILNAPVSGIETWEIYYCIIYTIFLSALLYVQVVKKFTNFAIKESGV